MAIASPSPRPSPTVAPSPTPRPTPDGTPEPLISLGATRRAYSDPLDDPSRWTTGENDTGSVTGVGGALIITLFEEDGTLSTSRPLPEPVTVLRVGASVTISSGDGAVGLACGTGGDTADQLVGTVSTRNTWRLATVVDGMDTTIGEGPLPHAMDLGGGGSATLGVECAATGTDRGDRVALWVDGVVVGDAWSGAALGSWQRATLVASVVEPALIAFFDDVVVDVGDAYAPVDADPAVLDLLDHVPAGWRDACSARRPVGSEELAGVVCSPAGEATQAEYYRYASSAALDAAFTARTVTAGETLDAGDCAVGPSILTWSVPGGSNGRIACFENRDALGGRVIVWTDDQLGILALGVRTDGGYADLYDWWLGAGPDA